jgi:hypothetical protein
MDEIDKLIAERKKFERRGTHFADGVMWCPNCGSKTVTSGHVKCEDCDENRGLTIEEFRQLAEENLKASEEKQAKRGGKDWVDEVAEVPEIKDEGFIVDVPEVKDDAFMNIPTKEDFEESDGDDGELASETEKGENPLVDESGEPLPNAPLSD